MIRRTLCIVFCVALFASCGENIFKDIASSDSDHYHVAEARRLINKGDYDGAQSSLNKLDHKGEEAHLLQAITYLGQAGFSLWRILLDTATSLTSGSGGSGMEAVFNALSGSNSVFGTGDERTERMRAIATSIEYLSTNDVGGTTMTNMRCILAGILLLPTTTDTTTSLDEAISAMGTLQSEVASTGLACPNLDALNTAMDKLTLVQNNLVVVLQTSQGCEILNFLTESGTLGDIAASLNKLVTTADAGCVRTNCGSSALCQAFDIPCVQENLDVSLAQAGDGTVHRCEILQNCSSGSACF